MCGVIYLLITNWVSKTFILVSDNVIKVMGYKVTMGYKGSIMVGYEDYWQKGKVTLYICQNVKRLARHRSKCHSAAVAILLKPPPGRGGGLAMIQIILYLTYLPMDKTTGTGLGLATVQI